MQMSNFSSGDLVEILTDRTATDIGMTTAPAVPNGGIRIYEKIDLATYPSASDFVGESCVCSPKQTGVIVRRVGRPFKIRDVNQFWEYDVYEVLVNDFMGHVFAYNLRLVCEKNKYIPSPIA